MKKKNLLLLSLLALSLTGCGDTSSSKSTSPKASDAPISTKNDDKTSTNSNSTKKDDTTKKDTTGTTDTTATKPDTTGNNTDTGNTGNTGYLTDTYESSQWPKQVKISMLSNLAGTILPYIDLGVSPSKLSADWDENTATLSIMGGYNGLSEAKLNAAKDTYEKYGWDAKVEDSMMTAVSASGDITVKYFEDDEIIYLTATYAEVFDPTRANSWPDTLLSQMDAKMGNHGADIPYVYLGTVNPTGTFSNGVFTITGGNWDDRVTGLASTAFKAANDSITAADPTAPTWSYNEDTSYFGNTFTASITLIDGTEFSVSIQAPEYSSSRRLIKMEISYKEAFNAPTTGSWDGDIKTMFETDFDNHFIPWFYIGSEPILDPYRTSGTNYATITGVEGTWDDRILDLAKEAVEKENQAITNEENKWVFTQGYSSNYLTKYTFTRVYEDHHKVTFDIQNYSSYDNKAEINVSINNEFVVPTDPDKCKWEDDITAMFNTDFGGHSIPWFYTGGTNSINYHATGSTKAYINGATGSWDDRILTLAQEACEAEDTKNNSADENKWQVSTDYDYSGNAILTFKKTYTDGCYMEFTLQNYGNYQSGNKARIEVTYKPAFKVPETDGSWSDVDGLTDVFTTNFSGHSIPWFYIGSDATLDSYRTSGSNTASIYGKENTWNDKIFDLAKAACEKENNVEGVLEANKWTYAYDTNSCSQKRLICTRVYTDGSMLKFTVSNDSTYTNKALINITYAPKFEVPAGSDWQGGVKQVFTDFDNHSLPYFYLGGTEFVNTHYEGSSTAIINGPEDSWNEQILILAKNACDSENANIDVEANKWTYTVGASSFSATRDYADGCTLAFTVQKNVESYNYAVLNITFTPKISIPTGDDAAWSSAVSADVITLFGTDEETLPWVYLGASKENISHNLYSYSNELELTGGAWNDKFVDYAYDVFSVADGWTATKNTYDSQLIACKDLKNGKKVKVILDKNYNNETVLQVYCKA